MQHVDLQPLVEYEIRRLCRLPRVWSAVWLESHAEVVETGWLQHSVVGPVDRVGQRRVDNARQVDLRLLDKRVRRQQAGRCVYLATVVEDGCR